MSQERQNANKNLDFSDYSDEELIGILRGQKKKLSKSLENSPEKSLINTDSKTSSSLEGQAFAVIYQRYYDRLIHYLYGFVFDLQIAEDLYQELMFKLFRNHKKFRLEEKFSSWIYRIASNTAITYLRKRKNRNSIAGETALEAMQIDFSDNRSQNPESMSVRTEVLEIIAHHIDLLPNKFKVVFLLRLQQNHTYSEIAEILKISERTAKWRMKKAVELLKKEMEKMPFDQTDL